jgi:hypothetical protein
MALLSRGPEAPVAEAAIPNGTSAARPITAPAAPVRSHRGLDLNTPHAASVNKAKLASAQVLASAHAVPTGGFLVLANAAVIHKNVLAYTSSAAAATLRRVQRRRQPASPSGRWRPRAKPSPPRCFSIASLASLLTHRRSRPSVTTCHPAGWPSGRADSPPRPDLRPSMLQAAAYRKRVPDGASSIRVSHWHKLLAWRTSWPREGTGPCGWESGAADGHRSVARRDLQGDGQQRATRPPGGHRADPAQTPVLDQHCLMSRRHDPGGG